ncbi:unnamed protein product [Rotaria socialis]|uniref:Uncharacterized protein n=1 Tax=Rotaria socialis TaxID=392032 RepID=A0A818GTX5_9BILA|nr:unnamed protein product [Rotaria socialis]
MQAIAIAAICITGVAVITGGVAAATIILAPIVSSPEDKFKTENEYRDPGKDRPPKLLLIETGSLDALSIPEKTFVLLSSEEGKEGFVSFGIGFELLIQ